MPRCNLLGAYIMSGTISGNTGPRVLGPAQISVTEGGAIGAIGTATLLANAVGFDPAANLSVTDVQVELPEGVEHISTPDIDVPEVFVPAVFIPAVTTPGVTWGGYVAAPVVVAPAQFIPAHTIPAHVIPGTDNIQLDPNAATYRSLAQGETEDVVVTYDITDGTTTVATEAVFHITGTNDAPVVSGSVTAAATEGGAIVTANALGNASDVDHGTILLVVAPPSAAVAPPTAATVAVADAEAEAEAQAVAAGITVTPPQGIQPFDASTLPVGVSFDAATNSFSLDPTNAAYDYLAEGQTQTVTVNYGVSDGLVVTAASVAFTVTGTNDAPVVSGPATTAGTEGTGSVALDRTALLAHASDVDTADKLDIVINEADLPEGVVYHHTPGEVIVTNIPARSYYGFNIPGGVSVTTVLPTDTLTLDTSNPAFDHLTQGQTEDFVVTYGVTDGHVITPAQAVFHLTGVNDAPVITAPVQAAATEDAAAVTANALANASDADDGTVLKVVAAPPPPPTEKAENIFNPNGVVEGALPPPPPILPFDPATLPAGVTFDAATNSFMIDPSNAAYQSLAAGQTTTVTVQYGVSDGLVNTAASAVFTVTGTNDAPIVSGPVTGLFVNEDGGPVSYDLPTLLSVAHDVDQGDKLTVSIDPATLPAGVSYVSTPEQFIPGQFVPAQIIQAGPRATPWGNYVYPTTIVPAHTTPDQIVPATTTLSIDPSDAAYQSLAQGEELEVIVNYTVSDGIASTPAQAIFTINGMNDAPVVSAPILSAATEDGAIVNVNGLANATDVDHGAVLSVVAAPVSAPALSPAFDGTIHDAVEAAAVAAILSPPAIQALDPATLPAGVAYDAATGSFSIDPSNAAFQYLAQGQTTDVTVHYGVSDGIAVTAASVTFTVTGTNDVPVVSGPATGVTVHEDGSVGAFNRAGLLAHVADADTADTLSVQVDDASLPAGVVYHHVAGYTTTIGISTTYYGAITSYVDVQVAPVDTLTIDPTNAAYQSLAQGEELDVVVNYTVSDGIASVKAQAIFQVIGTNDAPVVAGAVAATATEDGTAVHIDALAKATDVDHGAVLTVVAAPPPAVVGEVNLSAAGVNETPAAPPPPILPFDATALPAGVTFDAATNTFSIDPANAAYQSLSAGQTTTVTVNYGISDGFVATAASAVFTVVGTNDAPIVSGPMTMAVSATTAGAAAIATAPVDAQRRSADPLPSSVSDSLIANGASATQIANSVYLLGHATDIDQNDTLSVVGLPSALPAGISYVHTAGYYTPSPVYYGAPVYHPGFDLLRIDPSNVAFQSLAAGETTTITVNYGVTDGIATVATSASFTVTGVNDAPVVPSPTVSVTEDGAGGSVDLMSTAFDPDHGAVLSLASVQTILPAGISYDAATHMLSVDPTNAAFQSLAQGQVANYAIGFSVTDGQLVTQANAIVSVTGVNDAPVVVAPMVGTANEDGAIANIDPFLSVTDADTPPESLRVVNLPATLPAGVTFNQATHKFLLDASNAAYQSLSVGESTTVSIAFGISDGYVTVPANAVFTITGKNDAPVVSGVVTGGSFTAQNAPIALNLLSKASDIDHLDVLNVSQTGGNQVTATVTSGTWAAPVAFTVTNNQLVIDPKQFANLRLGNSLGLTFAYQVTDGNQGGSVAASATVAIQGTYDPHAPTGLTMADATSSLSKAQSGSGINSKAAIATFTQTGGMAGDSFIYTLGGTGASAFTMSTSANVGTLSAGNSPAVGAAGGKLYALNVTATDTTVGLSGPATSVDVVVGLGSGSGTINLASIPGMIPATPTFIYDLGGADTINGTGMTG